MTLPSMKILLLEPRARHRRILSELWGRALGVAHDPNPPELVAETSPSLRALREHLEQHTYEACVFPLLDRRETPQRFWRMLETAGYDIGYLFHAPVATGRRLGDAATPVPYLCKTRFGSHQRVLTLLGLMDMTVLEVRPPDETPHERYRKILNRIAEGFWDVGPDNIVSYANTAFKHMVGDERPVGRNLGDYFEEGDSVRLASMLAEQEKGIIIPLTLRLRNKTNGEMAPTVQIDPSPRFGWGGKYLGSSALVRDVSHLDVSNEESLRRERHLYALYQVAATLSRSFGLEDLVRAATDKIRELLAVDAACALVRREDGTLHPISPRDTEGPLPDDLVSVVARWCEQGEDGKPAHVVRDIGKNRDPLAREVASHGYRSMAAIVLQSGKTHVGYLWLAAKDRLVMNRDWVSLIISLGHSLAIAVVNALHVEARLEEEARRKEFYRDAIFAITNGKLSLMERDDLPSVTEGEELGHLEIDSPKDIQACRGVAEELLTGNGLDAERCFDVAMCISEAATNALLHGKGGRMTLLRSALGDDNDRFRIIVEDRGPGINFSNLPNAVLKRGYSTAVSMGLGFTMILEMMDAVYLVTDGQGTVVVMELLRNPKNAELEAWLAKVEI